MTVVQKIVRTIVHEIPHGRYAAGAEAQVELSSTEITLDARTKRFIEDNMLNFALKKPRPIVEDTSLSGGTPDLIRSILQDPDQHFIASSQQVAQNLFAAQTGNSPSGILVVAIVAQGLVNSVLIMKAEHQEGMRLKKSEGTFNLEHLQELIVGNNSKVYKIAILSTGDDHLLKGEMVDQQNGDSFAAFFMSTFLGCRLADDAEVRTRDFMNETLRYLDDQIVDQRKRIRYVQAISAYINKPKTTFQAAEFAEDFLEPEDRDAYLDALPEELRKSEFTKNTNLVPGRGSGLRIYASGVVVTANAIALENGDLEVLAEEEGSVVVRINGNILKYGYGSAPKLAG